MGWLRDRGGLLVRDGDEDVTSEEWGGQGHHRRGMGMRP